MKERSLGFLPPFVGAERRSRQAIESFSAALRLDMIRITRDTFQRNGWKMPADMQRDLARHQFEALDVLARNGAIDMGQATRICRELDWPVR